MEHSQTTVSDLFTIYVETITFLAHPLVGAVGVITLGVIVTLIKFVFCALSNQKNASHD